MKKAVFFFICSLIISSLANAAPPLHLGASLGSVWVHPQVLMNTTGPEQLSEAKGYRKAIFCVMQLCNHGYTGLEIGYNHYPFIKKHFEVLPAVWPPAGRPGENGEKSYVYDINLIMLYNSNILKKTGILTGFNAGISVGIARYFEGERRWDGYIWDIDQMNWIRKEDYYVYSAGWKSVILTTGMKLGIELFRLGNLDISVNNNILFRLTNIRMNEYDQALFEFSTSLAIGYVSQ